MPLDFRERLQLPEAVAAQLLLDLCLKHGFCLPPRLSSRISKNPPATIERFAQVVYRAEGLDPGLESDLYKAVRTSVALAFERYLTQAANES